VTGGAGLGAAWLARKAGLLDADPSARLVHYLQSNASLISLGFGEQARLSGALELETHHAELVLAGGALGGAASAKFTYAYDVERGVLLAKESVSVEGDFKAGVLVASGGARERGALSLVTEVPLARERLDELLQGDPRALVQGARRTASWVELTHEGDAQLSALGERGEYTSTTRFPVAGQWGQSQTTVTLTTADQTLGGTVGALGGELQLLVARGQTFVGESLADCQRQAAEARRTAQQLAGARSRARLEVESP
jgi:hypothetical protein